MPAISASAPGKAILLGEHAVVYGCPAIAVPVNQVEARATIQPAIHQPAGWMHIESPVIALNANLNEMATTHPLRVLVELVRAELGIAAFPSLTLRIKATIPPAAGLGSGAAVSVAVIRALSSFVGHPLPDETVCRLAYQIEKLYHGTPSGIDNTVITYNRPIYYRRECPLELLHVQQPLTLVIADTGVKSSTREAVGDVRRCYEQNPETYQRLFDQVRLVVEQARQVIETGAGELGPLMFQNHTLLQKIGVSSPELDTLVSAAQSAGALGAKLSGGGRGGNMIALARPGEEKALAQALLNAGATRAFLSIIFPSGA
ncbi:MAG TPA: mevalonate kinase [Anaerolineaceae bacterium]|nr:mevalonate kinase [Anaerolineaceae bacterium]